MLRLDYRPDNWEDRLVLFVGYLIQNKKQSATVRSYISAIKAVLREDNQKIDEKVYLIISLKKACRLQNDQIVTRLPIQKGLLKIILQQVTDTFLMSKNQPFLASLYRAIFSTMYYGLLRIGEVVTGSHPVLARDMHISTNKHKFLLILRTSKTHAKNMRSQMIKITATKQGQTGQKSRTIKDTKFDPTPCPYTLLKDYAQQRGKFFSESEPFFVFADKSPVTPRQVTLVLKSCIKRLVLMKPCTLDMD